VSDRGPLSQLECTGYMSMASVENLTEHGTEPEADDDFGHHACSSSSDSLVLPRHTSDRRSLHPELRQPTPVFPLQVAQCHNSD
jgi:hypothetical protein